MKETLELMESDPDFGSELSKIFGKKLEDIPIRTINAFYKNMGIRSYFEMRGSWFCDFIDVPSVGVIFQIPDLHCWIIVKDFTLDNERPLYKYLAKKGFDIISVVMFGHPRRISIICEKQPILIKMVQEFVAKKFKMGSKSCDNIITFDEPMNNAHWSKVHNAIINEIEQIDSKFANSIFLVHVQKFIGTRGYFEQPMKLSKNGLGITVDRSTPLL